MVGAAPSLRLARRLSFCGVQAVCLKYNADMIVLGCSPAYAHGATRDAQPLETIRFVAPEGEAAGTTSFHAVLHTAQTRSFILSLKNPDGTKRVLCHLDAPPGDSDELHFRFSLRRSSQELDVDAKLSRVGVAGEKAQHVEIENPFHPVDSEDYVRTAGWKIFRIEQPMRVFSAGRDEGHRTVLILSVPVTGTAKRGALPTDMWTIGYDLSRNVVSIPTPSFRPERSEPTVKAPAATGG
jgi:hypothetical protein